MEWSEKVEELLQKSLKLGEEIKDLKTITENNIREGSHQFDESLDASSAALKHLQEESDSLYAKSMDFSEEVQALEDAQKKKFSELDEEIQKEGLEVEQMGGSLTRLCDILTIKNDPVRQYFTPPVTFTLDKFHERKYDSEIWLSPYFYSHKYGYKMQLKVYPNGTGVGEGTHISMFVLLVPGEFDDFLAWPFCGIVTVHLINQCKNGGYNIVLNVNYTLADKRLKYGQKPRLDIDDEFRMGIGTFKLIAHTKLGEEGARLMGGREYLKHNCLSFCVWNISVFSQHH